MVGSSMEEGQQHRSGPDADGGAASRDLVDDSAERGYPYSGGKRTRRRIVGALLGGMAMAAVAVLLLSARGGGGDDAAILYERDDYP
jgi:hypothetical protein